MNKYFSIGELSKHQNISRQTLIFYDKIGLFKPAYVDPLNGYRYYSANQLDVLDTICVMKKVGFSLDEIKNHMKNYNLDSSLIAMRKQLTIIDNQIKELNMDTETEVCPNIWGKPLLTIRFINLLMVSIGKSCLFINHYIVTS